MGILAVVVGMVGLTTLMVVWQRKMEQKRTREMREAAQALGWSFTESVPMSEAPGLGWCQLFESGHSRTVRNRMAGERDGVGVTIFDYSYVTGSGRSRQEWNQTVLHLRSEALDLPDFSLRPENIFHKIGGAFGYQDIDFADRPLFSRKYLLRGSDEPAIRAVFRDAVLDFYEADTRACSDGAGSELLFWHYCQRATPAGVGALLDRGVELAGRLRGRSRAMA